MEADRRLNILLVDDDDIDVMNVRRAFDKGRIANPLFIANDGGEALEMLRGAEYPKERRLVLLDINMPRMTGIEFLRIIREDPDLKSLVVIVLTTSDDERDKIEAFKLNVAGYLLKPVTLSAFIETMAALQKYWQLVEFP